MGIAFGISRPPLREALKALTLMGVLESRQGGRYTVTDLSPSRLVAPFSVMLSRRRLRCVSSISESRTVVELELIRLGTIRATPEQRQRIMQHAVDGKAFYSDPVAFRLLDIEFHQSLNARGRQPAAECTGAGPLRYRPRRAPRRQRRAGQYREERQPSISTSPKRLSSATDTSAAVAAYRRHLEHVRDTTVDAMSRARAAS